jgi:RNA polymerase sigma-70 factor (ECF subfamily)
MNLIKAEDNSALLNSITVPEESIADLDLIKKVIAGEVNAYGNIMRRYNQRMFRIARSIVTNDAEAMDVVQEAHIKAYTRIADFRGPSGFFAWLAVITRNEGLMRIRKIKREVLFVDFNPEANENNGVTNIFDKDLDNNETPDSLLENKQLKQFINQNLDNLKEDYRIVFVLRSIEKLTIKETAEILDIKQETVKSRHFRAKQLLKSQMEKLFAKANLNVYEFGGVHCDSIIISVLGRLNSFKC